jgi:3-deoxy-manno-octulosonate cytidylyltransferase (CMP-KDO synthetase)
MEVIGLIPVRLNSTRLPSKALLPIDGIPMIVHTMKRAMLAKKLKKVYVCTDSKEIEDVVKRYGGYVIPTSSQHLNGTERIAEAAEKLNEKIDLYVDIQGDEPLIDPGHIDEVVSAHEVNLNWDILLPSMPFAHPESNNVVKVMHDKSMKVICLSRSVIPNPFRLKPKYYLKHLSIISFRPEALKKFANLEPAEIELVEGIELMRAIENGMTIGTIYLNGESFSVDVESDYVRAKAAIKNDIHRNKYN